MARAKGLKSEVTGALKQEFTGRGWKAQRGAAYLAPDEAVEAPLSLVFRLEADGANSGGIAVGGAAELRCEDVTEALLRFDPAGLPKNITIFPGDDALRLYLCLDAVSVGELLDPVGRHVHRWQVNEPDDIAEVAEELLAVLDGPLRDWLATRRTVPQLLDALPPGNFPRSSVGVRVFAVLYLTHDRPDRARAVLADYQPGLGDDPERLATFERDLAARFPGYGDLQHA